MRRWGFRVTEGPHARGEYGRFAGTDEERLADLSEALDDPTVDAVLCARGGYGLQRIIDRVPPIRKPILGFSDITALHQAAGRAGQPTLHSVMCKLRCRKTAKCSVHSVRRYAEKHSVTTCPLTR